MYKMYIYVTVAEYITYLLTYLLEAEQKCKSLKETCA